MSVLTAEKCQTISSAPTLNFKPFKIEHEKLLRPFVARSSQRSCEYNFANLFAWQDAYDMSWTFYNGRLLIYDGINKAAFFPMGEFFEPEELAVLSLNLIRDGKGPDIELVFKEYLEKFPEIDKYYRLEEIRDAAEYIYDVDHLVNLTGTKLHKKKNLIAQFRKKYPEYQVQPLTGDIRHRAYRFCEQVLRNSKNVTKTMLEEFEAIQTAFHHFDELMLDGIAVTYGDRIAAFSVFSRINSSMYDIQFEKSDRAFKGAGQVINQETAKYLKDKCQYVNREQDLGIKGLRQAKLSYAPVDVMIPYVLKFNPPN